MNLCVLLWPVPGREQQLVEYEDQVLPLLAAHGARVLQRVRALPGSSGPFEVQILEFPSEGALEQYMADPERVSLSALRDGAIDRTEVLRVDVVEPR